MAAELDRMLAEAGIEREPPSSSMETRVSELTHESLSERDDGIERLLEETRETMRGLEASSGAPR